MSLAPVSVVVTCWMDGGQINKSHEPIKGRTFVKVVFFFLHGNGTQLMMIFMGNLWQVWGQIGIPGWMMDGGHFCESN